MLLSKVQNKVNEKKTSNGKGTQTPRMASNERPHDKTNKMTCAPSKDSDQPGHPPSLISLRCALNG